MNPALDELPPAPLRCLQRHYRAQAERRGAAWVLRLPDGQTVPYDDGRSKTFEQQLADPDVQDLFSIRYTTGPIEPVTRPDHDPGRIRLDGLFTATYGASAAAVDVVPIDFLGQRLRVHRQVAPAFLRVAARLQRDLPAHPGWRPFLQHLGGTFVWRKIAGTDRPSAHSYGVSVDLNVERSAYWRWQRPAQPLRWRNQTPQGIVDAFEAEGFLWGGRWYHYDTMHFEYRPELLDPQCYPPP